MVAPFTGSAAKGREDVLVAGCEDSDAADLYESEAALRGVAMLDIFRDNDPSVLVEILWRVRPGVVGTDSDEPAPVSDCDERWWRWCECRLRRERLPTLDRNANISVPHAKVSSLSAPTHRRVCRCSMRGHSRALRIRCRPARSQMESRHGRRLRCCLLQTRQKSRLIAVRRIRSADGSQRLQYPVASLCLYRLLRCGHVEPIAAALSESSASPRHSRRRKRRSCLVCRRNRSRRRCRRASWRSFERFQSARSESWDSGSRLP